MGRMDDVRLAFIGIDALHEEDGVAYGGVAVDAKSHVASSMSSV